MDFFPDPPEPIDLPEEETARPAWSGPPDDVLPGVVPVELLLGRSASTAVLLTGVRAFPTGLAMSLGVRLRRPMVGRELHAEVFDGPYAHAAGSDWQAGRLKWGFELADGRRATSVDPSPWLEQPDHDPTGPDDPAAAPWAPDRPLLVGDGGGGGSRSVDRDYWLWPLPPAGRLRVVCQWPDQGVERTVHDLDAAPFLDAAARAVPVWAP